MSIETMTEPKEPEMKGWLQKWTNYMRGYQKRWFVISDGALSYYRRKRKRMFPIFSTVKKWNKAEMSHTCRGSISLHGAIIYTEDTCNFVVSNGGTQTFHLKAANEVDRQRWITSLELAKAKAIQVLDSEDDEMDGPLESHELQNMIRLFTVKMEDMQTYSDLITRHGTALQRVLGELESMDDHTNILNKVKTVNERATLFRITVTALINACADYARSAQVQGRKWQRAIHYEREQRHRLERMVEELAKQHTKLEEAAAHQTPAGHSNVQSDEDDDTVYYDAVEENGSEFTVEVPVSSHRRTSSEVSNDSQKSEGKSNSSSDNEDKTETVRCIPSKSKHERQAYVNSDNGNKGRNPGQSQKVRRTRVPDKKNLPLNLWSFMKNCIGKELTKIPMPVNFSEPLSMLQRLTEDFEYSEILDRAAKIKDSCEQLSHVAAFTVSAYASTAIRTGKPFNPLLGETYECDRMDDLGWRCINEQVSHHPPMAAQHCEGRGWKCWQEFTITSKFRGKYLQVIPMGVSHLVFIDTGYHYTWRKVTTTVHNIIVGKLWVDQNGEMDIVNHTTNEKCHLKYIPYSYFNRDVQRKVTGCVMNKEGQVKWVLNGTWDGKIESCAVLNQNATDKYGKPAFALGPSEILWVRRVPPPESESYYNFTELACQLNEPEEGVAPTDSRLRPDQRLMEEGRWDESNIEKVRLEEKQRKVRRQNEAESERLAAEGKPIPEYTPNWFIKQKDPVTGMVIHVHNSEYWSCKEKKNWARCPIIY